MRVVFLGTPAVAVPSLEALLADDDVDVLAVVTNPDRPKGRSGRALAPPVKVVAEAAGIPVWQPARPVEILEEIAALRPDACAVVAYGALLPRRLLDVGGAGFVNLHFSLLPRWRGAAPVQHAIRNGDAVTGVTTFVLDEGMDTGPVLEQLEVAIEPEESAGALLDRLATLGAPVLVRSLHRLHAGAEPRPQPESGATLAPKVTAADVEIDWDDTARHIADLVRSADPVPGAHTIAQGRRLKVFRTTPVTDGAPGDPARARGGSPPPGEVVAVGRDGVVVACRDSAIRLDRVQPEGKAAMDGAAYANGYRPRVGAPLADPP